MELFKLYMDKTKHPVIIVFIVSFAQLLIGSFMIIKSVYLLDAIVLFSVMLITYLFYIYISYDKEKINMLLAIEKEKFDNHISSTLKNIEPTETIYFEKFEKKMNNATDLINQRFSGNLIFKERMLKVINNFRTSYITNLELISEMNETKKHSDLNYDIEIEQTKESNKNISNNIDQLIKEFIIEKQENSYKDSMNEAFIQNMELFFQLKGIKHD